MQRGRLESKRFVLVAPSSRAKLLGIAPIKDLSSLTARPRILVMDIGEVIFIAQHETHHAIRIFRPGSRGSWHSSGIGKAITAYIAITDQKALFEKAPFEQLPKHTSPRERAPRGI